MFLGIDLGTSGVKAVVTGADGGLRASATSPLEVSRPRPLWSEQDPGDWWQATERAVAVLRGELGRSFAEVSGIGLSGQMHGACLLDEWGEVLRPAILWNDGRCEEECRILEERVPASRTITGNLAMPGFTAPKLLWVARHEPEVFGRVSKVLLPKDLLRLRMTGDFASDLSDSAGTLWLDVARRNWSEELLAACGLSASQMPELFEGTEATGTLTPEVARRWGLGRVPVAAGGGDNAAGAVGAGVVDGGQAFVSLGTSGVYFVADDAYRANPEGGVHTFCHCLPGTWHQMAVILSAASCLQWLKELLKAGSEGELLDELEARGLSASSGDLLFLPYLTGERTPHNDPMARGVFFGLEATTRRPDLVRAVLEGVAFAFADGQKALEEAGVKIREVSVLGGGARSRLWGRILASALGRPLIYRREAEVGPAVGAARLARLAVTGESVRDVVRPEPVERVIEPDDGLTGTYERSLPRFRRLYSELREFYRWPAMPDSTPTQHEEAQ